MYVKYLILKPHSIFFADFNGGYSFLIFASSFLLSYMLHVISSDQKLRVQESECHWDLHSQEQPVLPDPEKVQFMQDATATVKPLQTGAA